MSREMNGAETANSPIAAKAKDAAATTVQNCSWVRRNQSGLEGVGFRRPGYFFSTIMEHITDLVDELGLKAASRFASAAAASIEYVSLGYRDAPIHAESGGQCCGGRQSGHAH